MSTILLRRERWILRRNNGEVLCGFFPRDFEFKLPEESPGAMIKTYGSKQRALLDTIFLCHDVEPVRVRETLEILDEEGAKNCEKMI